MPNGYHGSKGEWDRLEAPLVALDPMLERFCREHGMTLSRNYHNWPERSLAWKDELERLIQIFLVDEKLLTFNVWLCASQDRGFDRFWKNDYLAKEVSNEELRTGISVWLEQGYKTVVGWKSDDLVLATKIQPLPKG